MIPEARAGAGVQRSPADRGDSGGSCLMERPGHVKTRAARLALLPLLERLDLRLICRGGAHGGGARANRGHGERERADRAVWRGLVSRLRARGVSVRALSVERGRACGRHVAACGWANGEVGEVGGGTQRRPSGRFKRPRPCGALADTARARPVGATRQGDTCLGDRRRTGDGVAGRSTRPATYDRRKVRAGGAGHPAGDHSPRRTLQPTPGGLASASALPPAGAACTCYLPRTTQMETCLLRVVGGEEASLAVVDALRPTVFANLQDVDDVALFEADVVLALRLIVVQCLALVLQACSGVR